ncbi:MAG: PEP-CTERM sorting domain-containing protein [Caulobacteraceae bacterium]|nr:PEP-CTERM sorting domain-containing protein [Caulobacteraceae bacterium]
MNLKVFCAGVVASAGVAAGASAGTVFNNPFNLVTDNGDCSWSTTCAADAGRGDDFAAQEFTITSPVVITSASFTELDFGVTPTDVNWGFIEANGPGGSPGTILQAGTDSVFKVLNMGPDPSGCCLIEQGFFGVGPMALGPGTYYFALQGISSTFYTYLGEGVLTSGAYETMDGGVTWTPNYEGFPSVSIGLYTVPEPASWALMLLGFGLVGGALRRRSATATA